MRPTAMRPGLGAFPAPSSPLPQRPLQRGRGQQKPCTLPWLPAALLSPPGSSALCLVSSRQRWVAGESPCDQAGTAVAVSPPPLPEQLGCSCCFLLYWAGSYGPGAWLHCGPYSNEPNQTGSGVVVAPTAHGESTAGRASQPQGCSLLLKSVGGSLELGDRGGDH